MKRFLLILLSFVVSWSATAFCQATSPASPWEMAVATERWLVEGAGARFPDGMADPASDGGYASEDITAAEANAMTESQIQSTPAFRRNPDKMLSSSISYSDQCEVLTYGIPSLSGPAGTRVLHFSDVPGINGNRNIDMDTCRSNHQEWGRNAYPFYTRWLHSDWKNMALPYVNPLFELFTIKGSLK